MKYLDLLADEHWSTLQEWLAVSRMLLVEIHLPRSGSSSSKWFVRSLGELRSLISMQDWPQIVITIYRDNPYLLRGVADGDLLDRALQVIPEKANFSILKPDVGFPNLVAYLGGGETHADLKQELHLLEGTEIMLGVDPDPSDMDWIYSLPPKALQFEVRKNVHY